MKKRVLKMLLTGSVLLAVGVTGCSEGAAEERGQRRMEGAETEKRMEESREETEMPENKENVQIIMEAAGCSEKSAERIAKTLETLHIGKLESAAALEEREDVSVEITAEDGKKYELGIDKKEFLYSVKDVESGSYLLAVYE